MSRKCEKYKSVAKWQEEWIGDCALRLLIQIEMAKRNPEAWPVDLEARIHAYLQNKMLRRFCEANKLEFGANGFERMIGRLIQTDFAQAQTVISKFFDFAVENKAEHIFRAMVIKKNTDARRKDGNDRPRPLACKCGSMNIHVWKLPPKIVCGDCKFEFAVAEPVKSATQIIQRWNFARSSEHLPKQTGNVTA